MSQTVDYQTAKELRDAGFTQPHPKDGQFWYDGDELLYVIHCLEDPYVHGVFIGDDHAGFCEKQNENELFSPTALEIIEQMPLGTTIHKRLNGEWVVTRLLTQFYDDERFDECPHKCAAKAYLAWKKGIAE